MPAFVYSREFAIDRARMYGLWTDAASLKQWFGPAGLTVPVCSLDLRPGGRYHFCMRAPDGTESWGLWEFTAIEQDRRLQWLHSFSDASGGRARHPKGADWPLVLSSTVTFEDVAGAPGTTCVTVSWEPHEASDAERLVFDSSHESMRGGWTGTFDRLAHHVAVLS